MILEIQHETCLRYSAPVTEWVAEMRVEPISDANQSCQTFHLGVSQPAQIHRYADGFGNCVHHFNLMAPHLEVRAVAAGIVETHPITLDLTGSRATIPIEPESLPLDALDYFAYRGPVTRTTKLEPLLTSLLPKPGDRVVDVALAVMHTIHQNFRYATAVTTASSPIDHLLATGSGVCQDFAHLMIALLRGACIPARYVSGYIHRPNRESQSHAWCEVWIPDLGWIGFDPTNDKPVDDHFVKVAIGRDFTDVPPNKGVYRGMGLETIFVRVETRQRDRLPTLSWREQLPPLDVPLTAVLTAARRITSDDTDEQQQQQ